MMLNALFTMRACAEELDAEPAKLLLEVVDPADMENVRRFFREHHGKPVMLVAADYRREPDLMGEFLDKCCVRDAERSVRAVDLFERFTLWMRKNHPDMMGFSAMAFGRSLRSFGFSVFRLQSKNFYRGLRLRDDEAAHAGGGAS